jgi:uncharacterized protein YbjT (DUF2867 family)
MTILVTGARGGIGERVADLLVRGGHPVRLSSRDVTALPAGADTAVFDIADPDTPTAALDGVRTVFLYPTLQGIGGFLKAAARVDLDHVVLLSSPASYQPIEHASVIGRVHRAAERALEDSGLPHTVLYPSWLASNARRDWSASIREHGRVALPYPDAYVTPVHLDDVAPAPRTSRFRTLRAKAATGEGGPVIEGKAERLGTSAPGPGRAIAVGNRVFHQKFGYGEVAVVEGNKLEIHFDKAGTKKVIDSFVELV